MGVKVHVGKITWKHGFCAFMFKIYMKAQKQAHFRVFSQFSASFYSPAPPPPLPLHHKGSIDYLHVINCNLFCSTAGTEQTAPGGSHLQHARADRDAVLHPLERGGLLGQRTEQNPPTAVHSVPEQQQEPSGETGGHSSQIAS